MVWRRRWMGLAVAWTIFVGGVLLSFRMPDIYQSSAIVFIDANKLLPKVANSKLLDSDFTRQFEYVRRTLLSRPNLVKVIERSNMGGNKGYRSQFETDRLINELLSNVSVSGQSQNMYSISYKQAATGMGARESAEMARRIVQNLLNIFVEGNLDTGREDLAQVRQFLDEQIAEYERQLDAAERARRAFEDKYGEMIDIKEFKKGTRDTNKELKKVEFKLGQLESSKQVLAEQLANTSPTIEGANVVYHSNNLPHGRGGYYGYGESDARRMEQAFSGRHSGLFLNTESAITNVKMLERHIASLITRGFTEQHPDMISLKMQLKTLKKAAVIEEARNKRQAAQALKDRKDREKEMEMDPNKPVQSNPVYADLRSRLAALDMQIASASAEREQIIMDQKELQRRYDLQQSAQSTAVEQITMIKNYEAVRKKYESLLQSREEMNYAELIENKADKVNVRMVQPPEIPTSPSAPNRIALFTFAFLIALGSGIASAFASSFIQGLYYTVESLRNSFNMPVLGSVSVVQSTRQVLQQRAQAGLLVVGVAGMVALYASLVAFRIWRYGAVL